MVDSARLFRVFVSSSFLDMAEERRALPDGVFGPLAEICAERGATFQAVDLRWGISPQAALQQQTMPICLDEVRRCLRLSPRLNFLALVGDRRGWLPVPTAIRVEEFALLTDGLTAAERELVDRWYRTDHNAVPTHLRLVPRAGPYVDDAEWTRQEQDLREVVQRAVHRLPEDRRPAYVDSAVEQEVAAGVLDVADPVGAFAAVRQDGGRDGPAADREHRLRLEARLRAGLPPERVLTFSTTRELVEALLDRFRAVIESEPDGRASGAGPASGPRTDLVGRDGVLAELARFARTAGQGILGVVGRAGVGKSALLGALAADLTAGGHEDPGAPVVIVRLLGTTAATTRLDDALRGLVDELAAGLGVPAGPASDLPELTTRLAELLARADRRVVMVLDAIDQLPADQGAHRLGWLPDPLPPRVAVVLSTLPGTTEEALGLRTDSTALPLAGLTLDEGRQLLRRWLADAGRTLAPAQERAVLDGFRVDGRPLWLRLAFEQVRSWPSDTEPVAFPPGLEDLVRLLFDRLADGTAHGPTLVRRTLALLAASGFGLSELDVIETLSADAEVMDEVRARAHERWRPGLKAVPVVLWARLRADLQPYLTERDVDGDVLIDFYHRVLRDVAAGEGLRPPHGAARHRQLAALFTRAADPDGTGSWRGVAPRAFDRLPAHLRAGESWAELAQTLLDFGFLEAKAALVGRVSSADGRIRYGGVHAARADLADLISAAPDADHAGLVSVAQALGLEADLLTARPELLWQQLSNRLRWDAPPDVTARLDAEEERRTARGRAPWLRLRRPVAATSGLLHALRQRGRARSCALSPDGAVLVTGDDENGALWDVPSGAWLADLAGHDGPVHACAIEPRGRMIYTADESGTLRQWTWDGVHARLRAARSLGRRNLRACASARDHVLVAGPDGLHLCARYGLEVVAVLDEGSNVGCCAIDEQGDLVVAGYLDGSVRTWLRRGGQLQPAARHDGAHHRSVNGCVVDAAGAAVLTAGQDGTLRRWEPRLRPVGSPLVDTALPRTTGVWACAGIRTLDRVATALVGGAVQVWDVPTARVTTLSGHAGHVNAVAVSGDGATVASAGFDGTVRLWDPAAATAASAEPFSAMVQTVAVAADGRRVLTVDAYGIVRVGNTDDPAAERLFETCEKWCRDGSATADLGVLAVVDQMGTVEVWDVRDGPRRRHVLAHDNVASCLLVGDGVVVSAGNDGTCHGWDVVRGIRIWSAELDRGVPVLAGSSQRPPLVLAAAGTGVIRLIDPYTGRGSVLRDTGDAVLCAAFGPGGTIAVGTARGDVLRWQEGGSVALPLVRAHDARVVNLAPGTSDVPFLSASAEGELVLWPADPGTSPHRWAGHEGPVRSVAVDPVAGVAVSAGDDKTLRVWTLSGEPLALLPLEGNGQALVLHPDSGLIACGDDGGFVYLASLAGPPGGR